MYRSGKRLCTLENVKKNFEQIQNILFTIGSYLACDPSKEIKMKLPNFEPKHILFLENEIDKMNETLPALKNFILPSGNIIASHCHVARCVCRRAERICIAIKNNKEKIDELILQYLNRLSDYLFITARYLLHQANGTETIWDRQ